MARNARVRTRMLDNPGRIVPCAVNIAVAEARGAIIVRVDGHTIIARDYVRKCVDALTTNRADCVGGCMVAQGVGAFGEAVALATSHPFGVGGSRFHYATEVMETDSVYLGAYRRDVFARVGGFDEEMRCNEDDEFNYRLRTHGGRIVLDPAIRSLYYNRSTVKGLWRQYFRYGLWKVRVAQKVLQQMRVRHLTPFALVAALIGGGVLAVAVEPLRPLWAGLAGVYLGANLIVSTSIAARKGWRHLPFLVAAFSILHFSYGTGFALGLPRFALRWRASAASSTVPTTT
jgi:hypothetical protein